MIGQAGLIIEKNTDIIKTIYKTKDIMATTAGRL